MNPKAHVPFALVLAGGGARGMAHAGVLRALEHHGLRPSAVVGVSMGAVVAVTYALNPDWYAALVNMDIEGFPKAPKAFRRDLLARIRAVFVSERMLQDMVLGWGVGSRSLEWGRSLLNNLTLGRRLEQGRIRVATVATDLCWGQRVVLDRGNAAEAAYASAALAGLLPPFAQGEFLLADGVYSNLVPVDVARGAKKQDDHCGGCPTRDGVAPAEERGSGHVEGHGNLFARARSSTLQRGRLRASAPISVRH